MNAAYRWDASGTRGRVLCLLDGPDERGNSWLAVCGDIDHLNVAALSQALTATVKAASRTTFLDLCHVGFVDSTVLHTLLEAQRSLRAARARLLLATPSSRDVERLLEVTGARTYFTFTNDAAAHRHCRPEQGLSASAFTPSSPPRKLRLPASPAADLPSAALDGVPPIAEFRRCPRR